MNKRCSQCKNEYLANLDFFYKSKSGTYGLSSYCRDCNKARTREWISRNKEKSRAYAVEYQAKNAERISQRSRQWYERNKEKVKLRQKQRRKENPNYDGPYKALKKALDPAYRMQCSVASKVSEMLCGQRGATRHLPYSAKELRDHIEKQFINGMCWANYGEWHLDHIIPRKSFRISGKPDCPEFQACWALTNLRPLWAKDNLSKGAKIVTLV